MGRRRDERLDFWRGLCLIDMVLVHLVYAGIAFGKVLTPILGEYLRFAAGGFVVMSGVCIGAIFFPRALKAEKRRSTYVALWKRSAFILSVHYAAGAGFILMDAIRGYREGGEGLGRLLGNILFWREGGDLLPLYVVMVAVSPLILELLRRGRWVLLLAASLAIFIWGQRHPWVLSTDRDGSFPLVLWQFVFICGVCFGTVLHKYDRIARSRRAILAGVAWAVYGVMFFAAYGPDLGLAFPTFGLTFHKVPLSVGELIRYFSLTAGIVLGTDLLWPRLAGVAAAGYIARLGRHSLTLYVAHLFLQELIVVISWPLWWMGAGQAVLAVVMIGLLGLLARWLDAKPAVRREPGGLTRLVRGWGAAPAGVAAAMGLLLVATLLNPVKSPVDKDSFHPLAVTATDLPSQIDELPPNDRNHDHLDDLLNTPMLDELQDA